MPDRSVKYPLLGADFTQPNMGYHVARQRCQDALKDLGGFSIVFRQPFVLTLADIGEYDVRYLGKENADEIPCYVFAVKPKKMVQGKRYFEGQIWVDDRDLQIVKTYGKGVGLLKRGSDNQFPKFETYREQVDGKYWFPTYTTANDTLHFQSGPQRIKMTVKYEDYKRFEGRSTIQFGDVVDEKAPKTAPPAAPPKK